MTSPRLTLSPPRWALAVLVFGLPFSATACQVPEGMDKPGPAPMVPAGLATDGAAGEAASSEAAPSTPRSDSAGAGHDLGPPGAAATEEPTGPAGVQPAGEGPPTSGGAQASYEGISFRYNPVLAPFVKPSTVGGNDGTEPPGEPSPKHIEFALAGYPSVNASQRARIAVYSAAAYADLSPTAARTIEDLRALLAEKPAARAAAMPYLPASTEAEIFHVKVAYLDFAGGSGVRYVTQRSAGGGPIHNAALLYTFQGLTDDGGSYISAVLPVTSAGLPADEAAAADAAQGTDFAAYLTRTVESLDTLGVSDFRPGLDRLDAMVRSLRVAPSTSASP